VEVQMNIEIYFYNFLQFIQTEIDDGLDETAQAKNGKTKTRLKKFQIQHKICYGNKICKHIEIKSILIAL
jgi:hypothetical protein